MSDITFTRGYGFPRGSRMDYAGYGAVPVHHPNHALKFHGFGGMLVNNRRVQYSAVQRIPFVPEPSIFSKIPALDGMGEDFGTEYTFSAEAPITCPPGQRCSELEFEDDVIEGQAPYGPEYRPNELGGSSKLGLGLLGLLALYAMTR